MQKLTVGLVCAVLVLFLAIFGAYTYKVRAANAEGYWQQPNVEMGQGQPIDVRPIDPNSQSRAEEPVPGDQAQPQPVQPNRRPILGGVIGGQPQPTPIQRPGYIMPGRPILRPGTQGCGNPNCPIHGRRGGSGCGPGGGNRPGAMQPYGGNSGNCGPDGNCGPGGCEVF